MGQEIEKATLAIKTARVIEAKADKIQAVIIIREFYPHASLSEAKRFVDEVVK